MTSSSAADARPGQAPSASTASEKDGLIVSMTVQLRTWTREEYYQMADLGFFEGQRVELLFGEIFEMSPQKKPHALATSRLTTILVKVYGETHFVRVGLPLDLGNSQPEPDFAVVAIEQVESAELHPTSADFVIEVSQSSLSRDQGDKAALYAQAGVPVYWILNLGDRCLEVYSEPASAPSSRTGCGYRQRTVYQVTESVTLPGTEQVLPLSELFNW